MTMGIHTVHVFFFAAPQRRRMPEVIILPTRNQFGFASVLFESDRRWPDRSTVHGHFSRRQNPTLRTLNDNTWLDEKANPIGFRVRAVR
jgi:hypothetical protein